MNQTNKVRDFFDVVSGEYRDKYKNRQVFHNYFFNQRLEQATEGLDFNNKKVLDIGAGTGNLFDYISAKNSSVDFYACDISPKMLEQSNIPASHRFVGKSYEIDFPTGNFDYIFMLGVTTYLDDDELEKNFDFIYRNLSDEGVAIITFTNRNALDTVSRTFAKNAIKLLKLKDKVISQSFKIYPRTLKEVKGFRGGKLTVKTIKFLNQTIFPFSQAFPKMSVKLADKLKSKTENATLLSVFSSDFIVFCEKKMN